MKSTLSARDCAGDPARIVLDVDDIVRWLGGIVLAAGQMVFAGNYFPSWPAQSPSS